MRPDRLVSSTGTKAFFDSVAFAEKEIHLYDCGHHELHNGVDHERVQEDYASWFESSVGR